MGGSRSKTRRVGCTRKRRDRSASSPSSFDELGCKSTYTILPSRSRSTAPSDGWAGASGGSPRRDRSRPLPSSPPRAAREGRFDLAGPSCCHLGMKPWITFVHTCRSGVYEKACDARRRCAPPYSLGAQRTTFAPVPFPPTPLCTPPPAGSFSHWFRNVSYVIMRPTPFWNASERGAALKNGGLPCALSLLSSPPSPSCATPSARRASRDALVDAPASIAWDAALSSAAMGPHPCANCCIAFLHCIACISCPFAMLAWAWACHARDRDIREALADPTIPCRIRRSLLLSCTHCLLLHLA